MTPSDFRAVLLFVSFGLIGAAAYHYGGLPAAAGASGVFWFITLLRK